MVEYKTIKDFNLGALANMSIETYAHLSNGGKVKVIDNKYIVTPNKDNFKEQLDELSKEVQKLNKEFSSNLLTALDVQKQEWENFITIHTKLLGKQWTTEELKTLIKENDSENNKG